MTLSEKQYLNQIIRNVINESLEEKKGKKKSKKKDSSKKKSKKKDEDAENKMSEKRKSVMKWLASAQEKHSQLAYELWHLKNAQQSDKDTARSLFSKKFRGHDNEGKPYSFSDSEITHLYSMRDTFIDKITESKVRGIVRNSIKQVLNESRY